MSFDLVVAADQDWGIGKDGGLPWPRLRADLQHFRRVTSEAPAGTRNAIVMGRKTWQSKEVAGKALPNRWNLVVSRTLAAGDHGEVRVVGSLDDAAAATQAAPEIANLFVVGGAELYRLALADARLRWIYLTRVDGQFARDTHMTDPAASGFRADPSWPGAEHEDGGVRFRITRLARAL